MKANHHTLFLIVISGFLIFNCASTEKQKENKSQNHLANALSPYLIEHADNPVDWHEWNAETLAKAKEENKPLLISIGYAACHWCHVMEEESFMDTAVANLMNKNFICIKVDREERPDVDQIYINAAQLLNGSAGWPLNAFALPDGKPFYAATYFPKEDWKSLLTEIINIQKQQIGNVNKQANKLTEAIKAIDLQPKRKNPTSTGKKTLDGYYKNLSNAFDHDFGGLKGVPKFPLPSNLEFLLEYHYLTGDKTALADVTNTLDRIAMGGMYDHVGGGFARYSTDRDWRVPHFEKMLYDNAQLVSVFSHAFEVTQNALYKHRIQKTLEFVERELHANDGGFYSSINADSEKEEGKFYVWSQNEIRNILSEDDLFFVKNFYSTSDSGNWENGKNIFFQKLSEDEFRKKNSLSTPDFDVKAKEVNEKLFIARSKRTRPSTDTKIITSWNALMITAYTNAFKALNDEKYLQTAIETARFIDRKIIHDGNRLYHSSKDGRSTVEGFLDDYALVSKAFIDLYQVTLDIQWLQKAKGLTEYCIENFLDQQSGLFFYTSDLSEQLVARKIELSDNVIPSSNSVMADVLFRMGEYYEDRKYNDICNTMVEQVGPNMIAQGPYYSCWASLLGLMRYNPYQVAIMGKNAVQVVRQIQKNYNPLAIYLGGEEENLPLLQNKSIKDQTIIYVCRNKVCKQPVKTADAALKLLQPLN